MPPSEAAETTGRVSFLFGVHDHQPVGNFDHVIAEACVKAYFPFFQVMEKHPSIKVTTHLSGCLWDWILAHRPDFIDLIKPLVARGQVEMLSGGYYEPIHPVIPEHDLVGQIEKLSGFLHSTFGVVPTGAWLTERVWEPHLPAILKRAGVKYTLVDDWHLKGAGVPDNEMHSAFVTDHLGAGVAILPIDERLRYLVPFKEPAETIAYLKSLAREGPGPMPVATLVDDGEKFGVWPETHDWVYVRGWMDRFLAALEGAGDWLLMQTCGEYLEKNRPRGPLYLGTGSYQEMMEWALPPAAQKTYESAVKALKDAGLDAVARRYLKGGTWRNFQMKYPEANWMHKKMLRISEKVRRAGAKRDGETRVAEAREALWRGQCNCAYWHGVFGGLYLNYLRQAVWRNLVLAERLADEILAGTKPWIRFVQEDVDADGAREIVVESDALVVTLKPDAGFSAQSWEIRSSSWNVLDTLARRPEAYHEKVRQASDEGEKVASIHDRIRVKEPGLEAFLSYDPHPWRGALQDRLFGPSATFRDARDSAGVLAELFRVSAVAEGHKSGNAVVVSANGTAETAGGRAAIRKTLRFVSGSTLAEIGYSIRWDGPHHLDAIFAVEWNVGLLAGDADDRYILADGRKPVDPRPASEGEFTASLVEAVDGWRRVKARFRFTEPFLVWRYPVWTVSQSEGGFERTYQSTVLAFCRKLSIAPGSSVNFAFQHDVLDLE